MDLLEGLKDIGGGSDFEESKNYYFENHICGFDGEKRKVMLDYTLSNDMTDKILRFGKCEKCGKVFFHRDFAAKSF